MNFRPELAQAVLEGRKVVTRRLASPNPRSPWSVDGCGLTVGGCYAVCPGRGKHAIGRVQVLDVRRERLGRLSHLEAVREGFESVDAFEQAFAGINGVYDPAAEVWRVEFELVAAGQLEFEAA